MPVALGDDGKELETGELEEAPRITAAHATIKAEMCEVSKKLVAMLTHHADDDEEEESEEVSDEDETAEKEGEQKSFVKNPNVCPFVCRRV